MDSITQIVLGAACGEAVLGKKIGNKALLFGAIGGTIPDLDVFVGRWLYTNEIDIMLFHRGFMHSFLFSILGAFLLGWLLHTVYEKGKKSKIIFGIHSFYKKYFLTKFLFNWYQKYVNEKITTINNWIQLFFWALFTHPILDAFTGYGTQLFLPFLGYRLAFNNISVVDVFYTIPFLICLSIVLFYKRTHPKRRAWLKAGIIISSVYMLFTIGNKFYVNSIFEKSLKAEGISYIRYQTQPSLFANILWYGTVETEDSYYMAYFSNFDTEHRITDWQKIDKNHNLIPSQDNDIKRLVWFSNKYYNIYKTETENQYLFTDLRYPLFDPKDVKSSVFSFKVFKDKGRWNMVPFEAPMKDEESMNLKEVFELMFNRMKGI